MAGLHRFILPDLVKRYLKWKQGDEEDTWANKAVETLIKQLKRQSNEQYLALQEVLHNKTENSPCITLKRSQDGRVQVSHKKMLPHVMYCRIFRWQDLQSHHELRSTASCQFPAQKRDAAKICINPYHYSRVEHAIYPPVVTPRNTNDYADAAPSPQSPLSPGSNYTSPNPHNSPNYFAQSASNQQSLQQPYMNGSVKPENGSEPISYAIQGHQQQSQQQIPFYPNQTSCEQSNWFANGNGNAFNTDGSPRPMAHFDSQSSPPPGYSGRGHMDAIMSVDDQNHNNHNTNNVSPDEGQEHWCRITYAELNLKIGEPFKGSSPKVIVDGFTDPSVHNRRFSLGVLYNINRNSTIEMTRRAIRRGVCLENCNETQIFVENLSESSIFFHSKNCNVENQLNQHAVVKIEPQGRHKIFDQKVFENLVQEAIRSQDGKTYERLFSLTEHCIIKMSFVKGWGSIYQRQDVTSTPCWIEIHLLKPYALIDQYLRQVRPPTSQITSTS